MASVFINATQARRDTRNNSVIHSEVRSLESAVLANVDSGVLYANVTSGTTMTDSNAYYKAFYGITNNRTLVDQIDYVEQYFKNLGYGITITENTSTGDTLTWNISW